MKVDRRAALVASLGAYSFEEATLNLQGDAGQGPTLHMLCGKVASGKSTHAARLGAAPATLVVTQDAWMAALYRDDLRSVADYVRLVPRLQAAMGPHIADLLSAGLSVVLDWPANTRKTRAWMRGIIEAANSAHRLHLLDVPDEICLARLSVRNAEGLHEYTVTKEEYLELAQYFERPTTDEGFDLIVYPQR
jgi:predicted kinase